MILWVTEQGGTRYSEADLPLEIGGSTGDALLIEGVEDQPRVALLESQGGRVVLRTTPDYEPVLVNDEHVTGTRILRAGDTIRLGTTLIQVLRGEAGLRMVVTENAPRALEVGAQPDVDVITPVAYRPAESRIPDRPMRVVDRRLAVTVVAAGVLGIVLWFILTAVSVRIVTDPPADDIDLPWTILKLGMGDRILLRPGEHWLRAEREGYEPLEVRVLITSGNDQEFGFKLEKLAGRLLLLTTPYDGVLVQVDGNEIGVTPLDPFKLTPGTHQLSIQAERYVDHEQEIEIEGGGMEQALAVEMTPLWSEITVTSSPPGAIVRAGANEVGKTPLTTELLAGEYELEAELPGHKIWRRDLIVEANTPVTLEEIVLQPADGRLSVTSDPAGAHVSLGETIAGKTPLEIDLASGETHTVTLFKPGYELAAAQIELQSGESRALSVKLAARYGTVELVGTPPGAVVKVDGRPVNLGNGKLRLLAVPRRIEISKTGYAPSTLRVTPRPGEPQRFRVDLMTIEEAKRAARKMEIKTSARQTLRLLESGSLVMGSPKGTPGRRPNENPVDVKLTRPFYIGLHEVTNGAFRKFRPEHRSRAYGGQTLDAGDHPVTSVTWEEAARYCNWLSGKEGLPPAYLERGGALVPAQPMRTGYRLPTEAEWAWAARFVGGNGALRYPWGDELPPPAGAGNYADRSAASILPNTMSAYSDGFPVSAPIGTANPNGDGIYDLGGNVAEWVQDYYTIYPGRPRGVLIDPMGPKNGNHHVIRGSSWMHWSTTQLRLAYRDYGSEGRPDVGFRIARYEE